MNTILDRLILILSCLLFTLTMFGSKVSVIYLLSILILSGILYLFSNKYFYYFFIFSYFVLCIIFPYFLFYLPVILYHNLYKKEFYFSLLLIPLIIQFIIKYDALTIFIFILLNIFSYFLSSRTVKIEELLLTNIKLRDTAREQNIELEAQNAKLIQNQDNELKVAKLNERNRIAREIHDNVGHMLSRSILQVAALNSINKNKSLDQSYKDLQNTLNIAMNSIRQSVHDLHDTSLSLDDAIMELVDNYSFCKVNVSLDSCNHLNKIYRYNILSIIKEALNNVSKHSKATYVSISYRNHPSFAQLIIENDGIDSSTIENLDLLIYNGIGLKNMKDRISSLHGNINFSNNNNLFRIFITFPIE